MIQYESKNINSNLILKNSCVSFRKSKMILFFIVFLYLLNKLKPKLQKNIFVILYILKLCLKDIT